MIEARAGLSRFCGEWRSCIHEAWPTERFSVGRTALMLERRRGMCAFASSSRRRKKRRPYSGTAGAYVAGGKPVRRRVEADELDSSSVLLVISRPAAAVAYAGRAPMNRCWPLVHFPSFVKWRHGVRRRTSAARGAPLHGLLGPRTLCSWPIHASFEVLWFGDDPRFACALLLIKRSDRIYRPESGTWQLPLLRGRTAARIKAFVLFPILRLCRLKSCQMRAGPFLA